MNAWITADASTTSTRLIAVDADYFTTTIGALGEPALRWCASNGFHGQAGQFLAIPGDNGATLAIAAGCTQAEGIFALSSLPMRLPEGDYALDSGVLDAEQVALGWALGAYAFTRYRTPRRAPARLIVDATMQDKLQALVQASYQVRDLINTPTEDMGPEQLAAAVQELAQRHQADYREWVGDELLQDNFPTIHAVGRASHRAPRLAMLSHGAPDAPHLVLIGKGVCFDTGGLDIKAADGMRWMKKDMGGAAHAIALASLVLAAQLPVRLTLLIPAVENSIAGNACRPGEVVRTRAGITVEIDNTDAEGRLVFCDAIAYAAELKPDLILDFATLTGAARIAIGPDLPALFCNRDSMATELLQLATAAQDPLWRMPLWRPYLTMLDSHIADLSNSATSRHAGAITAALFLERFVPGSVAWCHLDVYSWNDGDRPGRPRGGEAQGLRGYLEFLRQRYPA